MPFTAGGTSSTGYESYVVTPRPPRLAEYTVMTEVTQHVLQLEDYVDECLAHLRHMQESHSAEIKRNSKLADDVVEQHLRRSKAGDLVLRGVRDQLNLIQNEHSRLTTERTSLTVAITQVTTDLDTAKAVQKQTSQNNKAVALARHEAEDKLETANSRIVALKLERDALLAGQGAAQTSRTSEIDKDTLRAEILSMDDSIKKLRRDLREITAKCESEHERAEAARTDLELCQVKENQLSRLLELRDEQMASLEEQLQRSQLRLAEWESPDQHAHAQYSSMLARTQQDHQEQVDRLEERLGALEGSREDVDGGVPLADARLPRAHTRPPDAPPGGLPASGPRSYRQAVAPLASVREQSPPPRSVDDDLASQSAANVSHDAAELMQFITLPIEELISNLGDSTMLDTVRLVLNAPTDITGMVWRSRAFSTSKIVKSWATNFTATFTHRNLSGALNDVARFKFDQGLSSTDCDHQASRWNNQRVFLINVIRNCLQYGCDFEHVLHNLQTASGAPGGGNARVKNAVNMTLLDPLHTMFAPLAADVFLYRLDTTYASGKYGSDSKDAEWDACTCRHQDEDAVSMAERILAAYLRKVGNNYTSVTILDDPHHVNTINDRILMCLLDDKADAERGKENHKAFKTAWIRTKNHIEAEETGYTVSRLSCIKLIKDAVQPNDQARAPAAAAAPVPKQPKTQTVAAAAVQGASVGQPPAVVAAGTDAALPGTEPPPTGLLPWSNGKGRGKGKGKGEGAPHSQRGRGGGQSAVAPGAGAPSLPGAGTPAGSRNANHARTVGPPAGCLGMPNRDHDVPAAGTQWSDDARNWARVTIDFDYHDQIAQTTAGNATCLCRPSDASRTTTRLGRPKTTADNGGEWADDSCAYCLYRPLAPPDQPEGHANNWWWGTGNGKHNPYNCSPSKRYYAEGGDVARQPTHAPYLRACLRFPPPRRQQ